MDSMVITILTNKFVSIRWNQFHIHGIGSFTATKHFWCLLFHWLRHFSGGRDDDYTTDLSNKCNRLRCDGSQTSTSNNLENKIELNCRCKYNSELSDDISNFFHGCLSIASSFLWYSKYVMGDLWQNSHCRWQMQNYYRFYVFPTSHIFSGGQVCQTESTACGNSHFVNRVHLTYFHYFNVDFESFSWPRLFLYF